MSDLSWPARLSVVLDMAGSLHAADRTDEAIEVLDVLVGDYRMNRRRRRRREYSRTPNQPRIVRDPSNVGWYDEPNPRLLQTLYGKWLAVSEDGAPVSIGVVGGTEDEALANFRVAARQWGDLLADPPPLADLNSTGTPLKSAVPEHDRAQGGA